MDFLNIFIDLYNSLSISGIEGIDIKTGIWGAVIGGAFSLGTSLISGSSQRKKAKAGARAQKEQLKLQYAFNVNDEQRQMIYNQEAQSFKKIQNNLKYYNNITNAMFQFSTGNVGGSSIENGITKTLRTEKLAQDLFTELEYNKQKREFELYKQQGKTNLRRAMASADAGVPSSGDIFRSSLMSGISSGVGSYLSGGGTFGLGED